MLATMIIYNIERLIFGQFVCFTSSSVSFWFVRCAIIILVSFSKRAKFDGGCCCCCVRQVNIIDRLVNQQQVAWGEQRQKVTGAAMKSVGIIREELRRLT